MQARTPGLMSFRLVCEAWGAVEQRVLDFEKKGIVAVMAVRRWSVIRLLGEPRGMVTDRECFLAMCRQSCPGLLKQPDQESVERRLSQ